MSLLIIHDTFDFFSTVKSLLKMASNKSASIHTGSERSFTRTTKMTNFSSLLYHSHAGSDGLKWVSSPGKGCPETALAVGGGQRTSSQWSTCGIQTWIRRSAVAGHTFISESRELMRLISCGGADPAARRDTKQPATARPATLG